MLVMYNNVRIKNMLSVKYIFFMLKCQFMYVKSKLQISHDTIMLLPLDKSEYFTTKLKNILPQRALRSQHKKNLCLESPFPAISD